MSNSKITYTTYLFLSFFNFFTPENALASSAPPIKIAVASNFASTIKQLVHEYQKSNVAPITIILGSTGKLYAQIKNGAPYDLFLSADDERTKLLEKEGHAIFGSRETYAIGRLALWASSSPSIQPINNYLETLRQGPSQFLALANPKLAPYGKAAMEILQNKKLMKQNQHRIVLGENINQAFQLIKTGNAKMGIVSLSQIIALKNKISGRWWEIPQKHHSPISQEMILIKDNEKAKDFSRFLKGPKAKEIIQQHGYKTL
jgi:molybdate transport system substrate-binding protein